MAQTPERAAYLAMQRALRACVEVEGVGPATLTEELAAVMDKWSKKYPESR